MLKLLHTLRSILKLVNLTANKLSHKMLLKALQKNLNKDLRTRMSSPLVLKALTIPCNNHTTDINNSRFFLLVCMDNSLNSTPCTGKPQCKPRTMTTLTSKSSNPNNTLLKLSFQIGLVGLKLCDLRTESVHKWEEIGSTPVLPI